MDGHILKMKSPVSELHTLLKGHSLIMSCLAYMLPNDNVRIFPMAWSTSRSSYRHVRENIGGSTTNTSLSLL